MSTGQVVSEEQPAFGRSYQTPFADRIRNEIGRKYGVAVIAVGAISSYDDVNSLILAGRADLCALGRTHLYDPQWTLHAAAEQGYAGRARPGRCRSPRAAAGRRGGAPTARGRGSSLSGPGRRGPRTPAGGPAEVRGWPVTAFALTREQQDFAERVREIASGQLRALAEAGTPGHVNRELIKAMGDPACSPGCFLVLPRAALSREAAAMDLCLLREALATQSTEAETALALQGLGSYPVLQSGQEESCGAGCPRWRPATRWRRSR